MTDGLPNGQGTTKKGLFLEKICTITMSGFLRKTNRESPYSGCLSGMIVPFST
jgi:hypothetical protein